ncbi:hypothetical protein BAE44_0019538 [Dichanthelium oligosanthes]|uniref:CemA-like proton extrusion protein-related n=1 Tax=Dichanthelium oligosanthes TaxID=888268 RepID=A0A1E5V322_9POAL|nr:hypothetical protein BAE44_0019538 [Dichanthelium oligosanthes]
MRPPLSRAAFASVLLGPRAVGATLVAARCASSAASPAAAAAAAVAAYDHASFVKEIAVTDPPEHLNSLLNVLQARGNLTSLLRWPTAPTGMEMPVVEVCKHGLWLLAKNVNQYIHRILVEADINADTGDDVWSAVGEAGKNLYTKGDFKESQLADLDVYLLKKEAAELAGWEDEQIEFIREKVTEEGKRDDLKKGKAPEQVVLDEAAFLMDLASVDGNWDDVVDRIAECYREAGLDDIAKFIAYRE